MTIKTKNLFRIFCSRIMLILLLFTGLVPQVYADVIIDNSHFVEHGFQLSDIAAYPDYTFISRSFIDRFGNLGSREWVNKIVSSDGYVRFYKGVKKLQICVTKKKLDFQGAQEIPDSFIKGMTCSKILELQSISALPNSDPTQKITDVLNIDKVTDFNAEVYVKKTKVIYSYKDGTIEELPYKTQDIRPVSSRAAIGALLDKLVWYGLPVVALLAIFLIINRKRRQA